MTHDSQRIQIMRWLAAGHTLTVAQAAKKFDCYALSQRIGEVKKTVPVETEMLKLGKRKVVARYSIPAARERARAMVAA